MAERALIDGCIFFPWNNCLFESSYVILVARERRPQKITGALIWLRWRRISQQLREPSQSRLEPAGLQVLLIDRLPSNRLEVVGMISLTTIVVAITFASDVARLADSIP